MLAIIVPDIAPKKPLKKCSAQKVKNSKIKILYNTKIRLEESSKK